MREDRSSCDCALQPEKQETLSMRRRHRAQRKRGGQIPKPWPLEEAGSPVRIRFSEKSDPARLGTCSSGGGTRGPSTSVPTADFPSFIHLSADVAEKDFDPKRTVILARESESCITLL